MNILVKDIYGCDYFLWFLGWFLIVDCLMMSGTWTTGHTGDGHLQVRLLDFLISWLIVDCLMSGTWTTEHTGDGHLRVRLLDFLISWLIVDYLMMSGAWTCWRRTTTGATTWFLDFLISLVYIREKDICGLN